MCHVEVVEREYQIGSVVDDVFVGALQQYAPEVALAVHKDGLDTLGGGRVGGVIETQYWGDAIIIIIIINILWV